MSFRVPASGGDDTARLQAALDLHSNIRLEAQTYRLSSTFQINGLKNIECAGPGTRLLWTGAANGTVVQFNVEGHGLGPTLDAGLHRCLIDGADTAGVGVQCGQYNAVPYTGSGQLTNVLITGCNIAAMKLVFTAYLKLDRVVGYENAGHGLWISSAAAGYSNPNTTLLSQGSVWRGNSKCGVFLENGDAMRFLGDHYEDNGWEGFNLSRADDNNLTTRLIDIEYGYFEDNNQLRTSGTRYWQFVSSNAGASIIQSARLARCKFTGLGGHANNRHAYFTAGRWLEEYNEPVSGSTDMFTCKNTLAGFIESRSDRTPAEYWDLTGITNTPILFEQVGKWDSTKQERTTWYNNAGTATRLHQLTSDGKVGFFGATPVAKQSALTGDTGQTQDALVAYGLLTKT